jgi:hypothetical protein
MRSALTIERPSIATRRSYFSATRTKFCSRWMCELKVVTITRPLLRATISSTACITSRSLPV